MLWPMRWRRPASQLPLTGVAVAGAVLGHMLAYLLAVPEPSARVALLGATGHAYWTAAIAAASVLGLTSVTGTLWPRFQDGLGRTRPEAGPSVRRQAARLAGVQLAIYLVQEVLERLEAGVPAAALLNGRLLTVGVVVQVAIAVGLAVLLAVAGRVAEAAGRAWRRALRRPRAARGRVVALVAGWPSRLLAAGLGSRAPPCSSVGP
jgi:hypothetical protein